MAYTLSSSNVDYIELKGELDGSEIQEIVRLGPLDRIQTTEIPSRETLVALNDLYYTQFPSAEFRLYGTDSADCSFLESLPDVEKLSIDYVGDAVNLPALRSLKKLKSLRLSITRLVDFGFVSEIPGTLEQLSMATAKLTFDISQLARFGRLKDLNLHGYRKNIESLPTLPSLKGLLLGGITLDNLSFLNDIPKLKSLKIQRGNTKDFSGLYGNQSITALQIFRVNHFADAELLSALPNLVAVELNQLRHIDHLPDLSGHDHLRHISLDDLKSLTDLTPLEGVKSLESVSFACCPAAFEPDSVLPVLRNRAVKQCSFYTASDKKNKQISRLVEEAGKANRSNFMIVRNMLYPTGF